MPTLEFSTIEELDSWRCNYAKPERYMVCVTKAKEIIFQPTKTSRPTVYGYMKVADADALKAFSEKMTNAGFFVTKVKSFYWNTEMPPSNHNGVIA
jgi:hypothetical protein